MTTLAAPDRDPATPARPPATCYLLHQHLRYEYPSPVRDLAHRLMVVPPAAHGDQRRLGWRLEVTGAAAETVERRDGFANLVLDVRAARVEEAIEFELRVLMERSAETRWPRLPAAAMADRRLLEPSPLTRPDPRLAEAAQGLVEEGGGDGGLALARRINAWVHQAMVYVADRTDVHTTAAEALAGGQGVCQDYAHVMLAVCRRAGLATRYVSGHFLGEGGTHAWVEVLVPDPADRASALAVPLDPTHGTEPGDRHLTVALGRDYADVAPTSGTFRASCSGRLQARKQLEVATG